MIGKTRYFFFYLFYTILFLSQLHWFFIVFMNITSVQTKGQFMGEFVTSSEMQTPTGRSGLAMGRTHYSHTITTRELQYRYSVNDKRYDSSRISNAIIFPNPVIEDDKTITVYYNRFFHGYSVLVKLNFIYIILNLIPQAIIFIIMLLIKQTYMKDAKLLDLIKNYFKGFK